MIPAQATSGATPISGRGRPSAERPKAANRDLSRSLPSSRIPGAPTTLYLLPITSLRPDDDRDALGIPVTEIRRAGLTDAQPLWIIFDEHNRDTLERSFHFEHDSKIGAFSRAFLAQIATRFHAAYLRRGAASGVDRAKP